MMFCAGRSGLSSFPGEVLIVNRPTMSEEIGENPIGLVFPFYSQWARTSAVRDNAMVASLEFRHRRQCHR